MTTRISTMTAAAVLALALGGCGGDDGPPTIGCDWFAGDNCWKQTAAAAALCTDGDATGTFNVDTTQCSYLDGTGIVFATPASASMADSPWSFAVEGSSGTCVEVRETETSTEVTTALGTFREEYPGSTVEITCPDGGRYQIGVLDMLGCNWGDLPGFVTSGVNGTITFALLGAPEADPTLWRCAPPPL